MAISKAKKHQKVQLLTKELETSTTAIIGTFSKLTVAKDFELRKVIREAGGKYRVVKNKLAEVSSESSQVGPALKGLKGVNSVAFTSGDPVALAKAFAKWAGENAEFQFKLGIVDGKLLNVEEVKSLATMPGKLLFLINAPAQRLATVLNATGRDLAVVLGQGVEKEKFVAATPVTAGSATPAVSSSVPTTPAAVTEAPAVVFAEPVAVVGEPAAASEVPSAPSEVSVADGPSETPLPAVGDSPGPETAGEV